MFCSLYFSHASKYGDCFFLLVEYKELKKTALDRNLNSYMDEVLICNYVLRYMQWGGRYGVFISSVRLLLVPQFHSYDTVVTFLKKKKISVQLLVSIKLRLSLESLTRFPSARLNSLVL